MEYQQAGEQSSTPLKWNLEKPCLGLSVIQASKKAGAVDIVAIDIMDSKFKAAEAMGENYCVSKWDCWGCSIDCRFSCQFNAIPSCGEYEELTKTIADTHISVKPGKYIYAWFLNVPYK